MKHLIILLLLLYTTTGAQSFTIKGKVIDASSNEPLALANISVSDIHQGTTTNKYGEFVISNLGKNNFTKYLVISYVGYKTKKIRIDELRTGEINVIKLQRAILSSQTVLVNGTIGNFRNTPASFSKIKREDIDENYITQDLPEYLSYLPSTTFYSESGNGIGYNYLSIRGFDQRRISVSVNGIPQNDPEDHNVYWLDMPDLLESTEMIQVQRGAGSGSIGYPAIGGSINIITSSFSYRPMFNLSSTFGSFNTRKYEASFSSGLIKNKYSVYTKLSKTLSSGYRNSSWVNFNSFHVSAVRYDKKLTTQINIYGGPISDGLAYNGLPKFTIKNKKLRRENLSYWEAGNNNYTFKILRRPSEIENFSQPHFEILNDLKLNDNVTFNSALFLVIGKGFFDYDGSWTVYYDDYFRLKANGIDSTANPANALIRAQVENTQWGWIPRISIKHKNGNLILGGEFRKHKSLHWGSINFAEGLPVGVTKDYKYYSFNGGKDILNFYANENWDLDRKINLLAEVQLAYHNYKIYNEKYVGNNFNIPGFYVNPRIGINYKFSPKVNSYFSFARVTREPRLKNYYDAAESSAGEVPQFKLKPNGNYDFDNPLVKPETMNDFELGLNYKLKNMSFSLNGFYMLFNNEIVKKGQIDRFGQPITGNIDKTIHTGLEFSGQVKLIESFTVLFNGSYSKNFIQDGKTYINYSGQSVAIDLKSNIISGFPAVTFNTIVNYKYKGFFAQFSAKYVGDFYSDNFYNKLPSYRAKYPGFVSYSDNKVDAYFVVNFIGSYEFQLNSFFKKIKVFLQVNNLFDNLYASYAIGGEFFPAAERNFLTGVKLGL